MRIRKQFQWIVNLDNLTFSSSLLWKHKISNHNCMMKTSDIIFIDFLGTLINLISNYWHSACSKILILKYWVNSYIKILELILGENFWIVVESSASNISLLIEYLSRLKWNWCVICKSVSIANSRNNV